VSFRHHRWFGDPRTLGLLKSIQRMIAVEIHKTNAEIEAGMGAGAWIGERACRSIADPPWRRGVVRPD
jgi:hypothetical protein